MKLEHVQAPAATRAPLDVWGVLARIAIAGAGFAFGALMGLFVALYLGLLEFSC